MRIDLHVHSSYSSEPSEWILKQLGSRESYTDPFDLYKIAKARGMDAVTVTDHNSIEGCLKIRHFADTFISCEYTAFFPEDGCKIHLLCYNLTEAHHEKLFALRYDLYRMREYIEEHDIPHSVAHPFFSPGGGLTVDHFERLLELFDTFELNGAKDPWANTRLQLILAEAKRDYRLTGGSDDHSSLTIAKMWTETPGACTVGEFFEGLEAGRSTVRGTGSTPMTVAWNVFSVGRQWLEDCDLINGSTGVIDNYLMPPERRPAPSLGSRMLSGLDTLRPANWRRAAALRFVTREIKNMRSPDLASLPIGRQWFHIVERLTSKYITDVGGKIYSYGAERRVIRLFFALGLPLGLHALLVPFFVAFAASARQKSVARDISRRYIPNHVQQLNVVKFTDTFGSVDGVSKTLDEQVREARRRGLKYTLVTCVGPKDQPGVRYFEPLGLMTAPEYDLQKLVWPPFLDMLNYCYEEEFTLVQAATPGPMGVAALAIARTLGLPFQAVYHTQVPDFVGRVTDKSVLETVVWKYVVWFYNTAELVFGPSHHTKEDLISHGVCPEKLRVYPRGIDTDQFQPDKRTTYWENVHGVPPGSRKALFVGRVSKEKNLPLLVRAFKRVLEDESPNESDHDRPGLTLLVVGEGGYLDEMKKECEGLPAVFPGPLHGEELASAFASADFLVFPSTTDTYGRVVMEAMASGIPCIVSDIGGPKENVEHDHSGLVVEADNETAFADAIRRMAFSADLDRMGRNARTFAESRSFPKAFEEFWNMYSENGASAGSPYPAESSRYQ